MTSQHWILAALWVLYCLVHSALATIRVKKAIEKFMGRYFKYYRLLYSVFAFITLAFILWYQIFIQHILLFSSGYILTAGILLAAPGICIMAICIKKYFYELSGIQALEKKDANVTLQQSGLHKYVRHPLYLGTLLFIWGLFLTFPLLANLIACTVIHVYVLLGIRLEEKKLFIEFGEEYREYSRRVARLVPGLKMKQVP